MNKTAKKEAHAIRRKLRKYIEKGQIILRRLEDSLTVKKQLMQTEDLHSENSVDKTEHHTSATGSEIIKLKSKAVVSF